MPEAPRCLLFDHELATVERIPVWTCPCISRHPLL